MEIPPSLSKTAYLICSSLSSPWTARAVSMMKETGERRGDDEQHNDPSGPLKGPHALLEAEILLDFQIVHPPETQDPTFLHRALPLVILTAKRSFPRAFEPTRRRLPPLFREPESESESARRHRGGGDRQPHPWSGCVSFSKRPPLDLLCDPVEDKSIGVLPKQPREARSGHSPPRVEAISMD